jgi:hypothetical protein
MPLRLTANPAAHGLEETRIALLDGFSIWRELDTMLERHRAMKHSPSVAAIPQKIGWCVTQLKRSNAGREPDSMSERPAVGEM